MLIIGKTIVVSEMGVELDLLFTLKETLHLPSVPLAIVTPLTSLKVSNPAESVGLPVAPNTIAFIVVVSVIYLVATTELSDTSFVKSVETITELYKPVKTFLLSSFWDVAPVPPLAILKVPEVILLAANPGILAVIVTFPEPSKVVDPLTSPERAIVLAVANLFAEAAEPAEVAYLTD